MLFRSEAARRAEAAGERSWQYKEAARQCDRYERQPQIFLGGGHTRCGTKPGSRPELTPRAYYKQRITGQAPCYAVKRTVSPVRAHSPVRYRAVPPKVSCECGHPARAYGACSACLVAGTPFRSRVSGAGSACCVSGALGGCSASYACAPLMPAKCGSGA